MSYNGSGTFLINTAGQPVVSGTVISSTAFNALTADLATGLSTAITKDGQTTITANIPMANYKFTGLGVGSAAGDSANLSQVQSTAVKLLASVSGADTITAVGSPNVAAYVAGQMFYFVAAAANTGAVTINIDSLGAKSITRDGTTALAAGDIQSGEVCVIVYDGTQFQLVNGASQSAAIVTNSLTVNGTSSLDGAVTINDSGADVDFRVEGDTDANLLFVDASTDRVGVGTNAPAGKFDVSGTSNNVGLGIRGSHSAGDNAIFISPASAITGSYAAINSIPSATTGVSYVFGNSNNADATGHSRIDAYVGGASGGDPKYTYTIAGVINWCLGVDNSDSDKFKISASDAPGSSDLVTIDTSGNLALTKVALNSDTPFVTGANISSGSNPIAIGNTGSAVLHFFTNNTERARITSGGNFWIGTTTANDARLRVVSVAGNTQAAYFSHPDSNEDVVSVENTATSGDNILISFYTDATVKRGSITYNRAGGLVAYNTTSDYRAKDITGSIEDAGSTIDALKVYTGKIKDATVERPMLIAHEAQEVAPYAVTGEKDAVNEDGTPKYQQIDHSSLVPLLIAEIQSLRARVAALEAK